MGATHKNKMAVIGRPGVGKTSLIRRYVDNQFDERYITTIGTNISRKTISFSASSGEHVQALLQIWDLAGQAAESEKAAYLHGSRCVLAVCDLSRPGSAQEVEEDLRQASAVLQGVPVVIIANKLDLVQANSMANSGLEEAASRLQHPIFATSAKTGLGVQDAFTRAARLAFERAKA